MCALICTSGLQEETSIHVKCKCLKFSGLGMALGMERLLGLNTLNITALNDKVTHLILRRNGVVQQPWMHLITRLVQFSVVETQMSGMMADVTWIVVYSQMCLKKNEDIKLSILARHVASVLYTIQLTIPSSQMVSVTPILVSRSSATRSFVTVVSDVVGKACPGGAGNQGPFQSSVFSAEIQLILTVRVCRKNKKFRNLLLNLDSAICMVSSSCMSNDDCCRASNVGNGSFD